MRSCRQVLFPSDDCRYHAQGKSKGRCVFWRMVQTKGFKTVKTAPPNSRQRSLVSLSIQHNSVLSKLNEDVEAPLHVRTSSLPARAYTSQMSSPQKGLIFFFLFHIESFPLSQLEVDGASLPGSSLQGSSPRLFMLPAHSLAGKIVECQFRHCAALLPYSHSVPPSHDSDVSSPCSAALVITPYVHLCIWQSRRRHAGKRMLSMLSPMLSVASSMHLYSLRCHRLTGQSRCVDQRDADGRAG